MCSIFELESVRDNRNQDQNTCKVVETREIHRSAITRLLRNVLEIYEYPAQHEHSQLDAPPAVPKDLVL